MAVSLASNAVLYLSMNAFSCSGAPARTETEIAVTSAQTKMLIFIGVGNEPHRTRLGPKKDKLLLREKPLLIYVPQANSTSVPEIDG